MHINEKYCSNRQFVQHGRRRRHGFLWSRGGTQEMGNGIWITFSGWPVIGLHQFGLGGDSKGPKILDDKQKNRTLPRKRIFGFLGKFSPRNCSLTTRVNLTFK